MAMDSSLEGNPFFLSKSNCFWVLIPLVWNFEDGAILVFWMFDEFFLD